MITFDHLSAMYMNGQTLLDECIASPLGTSTMSSFCDQLFLVVYKCTKGVIHDVLSKPLLFFVTLAVRRNESTPTTVLIYPLT